MRKIKDLKGKAPYELTVIALILTPLSVFLLGQYIYTGVFSLYSFSITIINYIVIAAILWLLVFITNSYKFSISFTHIAYYIWSLACYYVHYYRGNPVLPWDLTALKTAGDVMLAYKYYPTSQMIIGLIYIIILTILIYYFFPKRSFGFKKETIGSRAVALVITILCVCVISDPKRIESYGAKTDVWDQDKAYREGGTLAVFLANTRFLEVEVPEGYDSEVVHSILDDVKIDTDTSDIKPNIIAIMNESWSDLEKYGGLNFSESVTSKIKGIDNIYFDYAYASVFGAGTSASEYEFLTGNSMAFLPSGSIPYQQYVLEETSSLASILKAQGYDTKAFHPGDRGSWNRDKAYPLMGFDSFKSIEDMIVDIREAHGGYVSDESNFDQIIKDFEECDNDKPLFYFNVTIQSHGGYEDTSYQNTVSIIDHEGEYPMAEQYLSLVKETDDAFYDFIEYFKEVDEPVVIIMFGDHKPALEEEFYELLYANGDEQSMEEYMARFEVPYVIWANYDLDIDIGKTSLNMLGQALLETLGLDTTLYSHYLNDLKEELPVISFPGYFDDRYNAYSHLETNDHTEKIKEYQIIQYDSIFDTRDRKYYYDLAR